MKRVSKSLELWNLRWNKESMSKGQKCHSARIFKRWRQSSGDYIWQDLLAFNSILLFLPACLLGARGLWKFTAARRTPETTSYWCSSWKAESFGLTKERLCLSVLYTPQNNISGLKFAKGTCWLALDALSIFAPWKTTRPPKQLSSGAGGAPVFCIVGTSNGHRSSEFSATSMEAAGWSTIITEMSSQ